MRLVTQLAATVVVLTGCSSGSRPAPGPSLPVQRVCGVIVSYEVELTPTQLGPSSHLRLNTDQAYLLRFDRSCAGAHVSPDPQSVLTAQVTVPGRDGGLAAGVYLAHRPTAIRFRVQSSSGAAFTSRVVFRNDPCEGRVKVLSSGNPARIKPIPAKSTCGR